MGDATENSENWNRIISETKRTLKAWADKRGITVQELVQEAWDYGLKKIEFEERFGSMPNEYDPAKDASHPSRGWSGD